MPRYQDDNRYSGYSNDDRSRRGRMGNDFPSGNRSQDHDEDRARGYGESGYGGYGQSSGGRDYGSSRDDDHRYGERREGGSSYGRGATEGQYGGGQYGGGEADYGNGGRRSYGQGGMGSYDQSRGSRESMYRTGGGSYRGEQDYGGSSSQGQHRGKGPKGYARSDDRIKEQVSECMSDDHMLDASEIDVQVKDGEVTLGGTVSDRRAKRHAEDIIEHLGGVKHVQNNLRIKEQDANTPQTSTGKTGTGKTGA